MKKRLIFNILVYCCILNISAHSKSDIMNYISKYKDIALKHEKVYGIPASITLAQGILESGAGTSGLTRNGNNHFGVKAGSRWKGNIYKAWDDEPVQSKFRIYSSAEESYEDHAKVLKGKRYQSLYSYSVYDYRAWAFGLQKAGYATAKKYAQALIGYIEAYKLYALNGGVKLKAGKTVVITKYNTKKQPVFDAECQLGEDEQTDEEQAVKNVVNRYLVEINDVRCTFLYPGETLSSISMKYNISKDRLLKYNVLGDEDALEEGDIVFLEKKKSKYEGARDFYKVKENDDLYSISQQFGIKVANLAKMNNMNLFTQLKIGERLKLK